MNQDTLMTLDDAVAEVLGIVTDLDVTYDPRLDRYRSITRCLNRALRANSREQEWSYYSSQEDIGIAVAGQMHYSFRSSLRPRIINDDAVRLVDDEGRVWAWAYFLPRDALGKYPFHSELKAAVTRTTLSFSRPFTEGECGLHILVPVMREPKMFRLPDMPEDPDQPIPAVPQEVRDQPLDFDQPDVVTMRAAYMYALTDPVIQPRAQTLEAEYKDIMYQLIERDTSVTDTPYVNPVIVPIDSDLRGRMPVREFPVVREGFRD